MMPEQIEVSVQPEDFDAAVQMAAMRKMNSQVGAIACFVGIVRDENKGDDVMSLELEYYPGMTQRSIYAIVEQAFERWQLLGARVIHRVGKLAATEQIVFVAVSSKHRAEAFEACEFIMDYLKTRAPFWKKEFTTQGERWVEASYSDNAAVKRWSEKSV